MKTSPVLQFYKRHWFDKVLPLLKTHEFIRYELQRLCTERIERLEDCLAPDLSLEDLDAEMCLEEHIGRVRRTHLHWLCDSFGADDLYKLSRMIAGELFPDVDWIEIEEGDEIVVTDPARTIVFDFHHAHTLSGRASLALCGDPADDETLLELDRFHGARLADQERVIETMRAALAAHRESGVVIDLPQKK